MLVEYQGERFRISERTYEQLQYEYPDRAKKLKIIKDSEEYYNLDKLLQLIEPDKDKIKRTIIKNYTYANDKYNEHLLNQDMDEMEKYFGAKEMTRKIGIELINYDPEKNLIQSKINQKTNIEKNDELDARNPSNNEIEKILLNH